MFCKIETSFEFFAKTSILEDFQNGIIRELKGALNIASFGASNFCVTDVVRNLSKKSFQNGVKI